jgi:hypothetical protein
LNVPGFRLDSHRENLTFGLRLGGLAHLDLAVALRLLEVDVAEDALAERPEVAPGFVRVDTLGAVLFGRLGHLEEDTLTRADRAVVIADQGFLLVRAVGVGAQQTDGLPVQLLAKREGHAGVVVEHEAEDPGRGVVAVTHDVLLWGLVTP